MKSRIMLAMFGCALLSTSYISTEMNRVSSPSRGIASIYQQNNYQQVAVQNTVTNINQKVTNVKQDITQIHQEINNTQINITNSAELLGKIVELSRELETVSTEKDKAEGSLKVKKAEVKKLQSQLASLRKQLQGKVKVIAQKDKEISEAKKSIEAEKKKTADLEKKLVASKKQLEAKVAELKKSSSENEALKKEIARLENQVVSTQDLLSAQMAAQEQLEQKHKAEIEAKDGGIAKLKQSLSEKEAEMAAKVLDLNDEIETQNMELCLLREAVAEYDEAKKELEELKLKLASIEKENEELKSKNTILAECYKELQNDLEKQVEEHSKKMDEVLAKLSKLEDKEEDDKDSDEEDDKEENDKKVSKAEQRMLAKLSNLYAVMMQNQMAQSYVAPQFDSSILYQNSMVSSLGLNGDYGAAFNKDILMFRELQAMRDWSQLSAQARFDAGGSFGYNSSMSDNFHNRYISGSPMLYTPAQSYQPLSFNMMSSGYDFSFMPQMPLASSNSSVNKGYTFSQVQPMQPSFISIN
jgi:DNA repair exonuclease SbcCD ATPase subunit